MPSNLTYMPQRYRWRRPVWHAGAILSAILGLIVAIVLWWDKGRRFRADVGLFILFAMSVAATFWTWLRGDAPELLIEGGALSFRSPGDGGFASFSIQEIEQVVFVTRCVGDSDEHWCELVVRDRGRMRVDCDPLVQASGPGSVPWRHHDRFKAAILAENPAISFDTRDGGHCHDCGERLFAHHRCPACGAHRPKAGRWV
jgi:hypothetical protein